MCEDIAEDPENTPAPPPPGPAPATPLPPSKDALAAVYEVLLGREY